MILIMSASISPAKISKLCLRDTETRLRQYCAALQYYIKCKKFDKIVFCDNSNYSYQYETERHEAERCKVQLEILKFSSKYQMIEKYGKGYGEGEILKYVIQHSELLAGEDYFYKVTGRLIVTNIALLVKRKCKVAQFNRNLYAYKSVDTRFWGINKEQYIQYLEDSFEKVNDDKGRYLEVCYKRDLDKNKIKYQSFCVFPVIDGYSGTIGEKYKEFNWYIKIIYDIMCFLDLYNSEIGFMVVYLLFNVVIRKRKLDDVYYTYLTHNT